MTARCEFTELYVDQCAHCLGHQDVETIDYTTVKVHHTMNARLDGRCALNGKHTIVEGDRIGRTDDGWACTSCVDRAGGAA
jgi:hypothetical protein